MPKTLHIASTLEWVGPEYESGRTHFSLLLSAWMEGDFGSDDLPYLLPCDWVIDDIALIGERKSARGGWQRIAVKRLKPRDSTVSLIEPLRERHARLAAKAFPVNGPSRRELFGGKLSPPPSTSDENVMLWAHELAHFSRYPAPLPHAVNLCVIFSADKRELSSYHHIYAAPIFSSLRRGQALARVCRPRVRRARPIPGSSVTTPVQQYLYAPAGLSVVAHVNQVSAPEPTERSIIDIKSLWLKQPAGDADFYDDDWQANFAADASRLLDLPHLMLEGLQDQPLRDRLRSDESERAKFVNALLSVFRDTASLGVFKRPDGRSLIDDVLQGLATTPERLKTIHSALVSYDEQQSLESWMGLLLADSDRGVIDLLCPFDLQSPQPRPGADESFDRLRQAQRRLADPDVLATVIRKQWTRALAGQSFSDAERRPLDAHIDNRLAALELRPRLLLAQVNLIWNELMTFDRNVADRTQLENRTATLAGAHVRRRLRRDAHAAYDGLRPRINQVPDTAADIANYVTRVACEAAKHMFASAHTSDGTSQAGRDNDASARRAGMTAHSISLQIDRLGTGDSADDYARRLSGIGVLMRRRAADEWRCLNLATVERANGRRVATETTPPAPTTDRLVLVPVPLIDRDGVRQALVTVNNQPLIARSPTDRLAGDWELQSASASTADPARAIVTFRNAARGKIAGTQAEWARVPTLVFGESPQIALFAVGNAGLLPTEIASPTDPTMLKAFGVRDPLPHQRAIRYRRQVPIGPIRVGPPQFSRADDMTLDPALPALPVIPDGVQPLGRDLLQYRRPAKVGNAAAAARAADASSAADSLRPALVFLVPPDAGTWKRGGSVRSQHTFGLRPPAVELNSWDRWMAADGAARDLRAMVWTNVNFNQVENANATPGPESERRQTAMLDPTLDDPALQRDGRVEVFRIGANGQRLPANRDSNAALSRTFRWNVLAADALKAETLSQLRAQPYPVTFNAGTTTAITGVEPSLVIDFAPGVWEVRFWGMVRRSEARDRFSTAFAAAPDSPDAHVLLDDVPSWREDPELPDVYLVAPLRFIVEVADATMPSETDLRNRLGFSDRDAHALEVRLLAADDKFKHVIGGELLRQVWRWDGRPQDPPVLPAPSSLDTNPGLKAWEVDTFGERSNSDHLQLPLSLVNDDSIGRHFLYRENLQSDLRAHYYRFAVRARSRYAPLMVKGATVTSWNDSAEPWTHWRRHVVRCRRTEPLPKPAVRGILPLTELAEGSDAALPGVIVVLDEAWYKQAGLGEVLNVEVRTSTVDEPLRKALAASDVTWKDLKEVKDLGPDPIVSGQRPPWVVPGATATPPALDVVGPVGHTFDVNTTVPLFVASSFIIRPHWSKGVAGEDLRWFFARLRFRRALPSEWSAFGLEPSEWTQPYWVQFLPDSSQYDFGERTPYRSLTVRWENDALRIVRRDTGSVVPFTPMPSQSDVFRLYALVTRRVFDAGGRRDQERYVGIFRPSNEGTWRPLDPLVGAGIHREDALIVRVLEVQLSPKHAVSGDGEKPFWEALFPRADVSGATEDATARIVRLSKPIYGEEATFLERREAAPACEPEACR